MAKAVCRLLKLRDRLQHNPVLCVLCLRPVRDELQPLPCQHVFCVPCFEDYSSKQAPLTDPTARLAPTVYCPTCLLPTTTPSQHAARTSKQLPEQLKALVAAVEKQRCSSRQHGRQQQQRGDSSRSIAATCVTCSVTCCATCASADEHAGHTVLWLPVSSRNGHARNGSSHNGTAHNDPAVAWRLEELVDSVSRRHTLVVQAERLQLEQEHAQESAKKKIQADTRNRIMALRLQEAELLRQVDQHYDTVKANVTKLQEVSRYMAHATEQHIRYLHLLLHEQPKRCKELLVNQPALFARTRSLLLDSPPATAPASTQLTETACIQCITQLPRFQPGDTPTTSSAQHGTLCFKKRPGYLPAVSQIEYTLQAILTHPDGGDNNNKRTHTKQDPVENDEDEDEQPSALINYRIRDKPQPLVHLYDQGPNVEPASALFLPDDRLVVAETKGKKVSIWKPNCKKLDRDIVSSSLIFPFAITYWAGAEKLVYTDWCHHTVGFVGLEDEEPERVPGEILRQPHGVGVLPSNHLIASDQYAPRRGVKIIDPYRTSANIVRTYHQHGNPAWLTVLRDGRVAVTDRDADAVYLYDANGSKIAKMSVEAPEQVTEDYSGDLLIASAARSTVMLYDGRQLKHRSNVLSMEHGAHAPVSLALTTSNGKLAAVLKTGSIRLYQFYDCD